MTGVLVMINNYFHDLSVALLFVSVLSAIWLSNGAANLTAEAKAPMLRVAGRLRLVAWASLALVIAFGYVRAVNYKEFEWITAVGNRQVAALVVKHIMLIGVTVFGIRELIRSGRRKN